MATRLRRALFFTAPLCVFAGVVAVRGVRDVETRNRDSVVATFPAQPTQVVDFPSSGSYWVFAAGSREAVKAAESWDVSVTDSTGRLALVSRPDAPRAKGRENRPALDLLFIIRVADAGRYAVRLTPDSVSPGEMQLRITRFSPANAGAAMRAFGLAVLFSLLLVVNAVIWFRSD
ncbi:MAG: hypothetical protein H7066_11720 [Cytophagaceae bacterium]|nr:hypothetical protein [Gemmatimonadaceae bacterium]